jgi:S-adenosylmethionine hydrolase
MKGVILGSTGYLEIAVNGGNAARALGLKLGDIVEVA